MKTARQTALEILIRIKRDGSYSNLALDSELNSSELETRDKAFATALVYGVTERRITLEYQLSLYLGQPIKKLKPPVLNALLIGAYQLIYMDKIPSSAAVNESVKLVKNNKSAYASGLVNAVLHKIDKNGLVLPDETAPNYLTVKYSCPNWLCKMWTEAYGEDNAKALLDASFGSTEVSLRVNTLKCTADELVKSLEEDGISSVINEDGDSLTAENGGALHLTKAYKNGLFHVQDRASQLCCKALGANEDDVVLDICSAPGGKSFTVAELMNNHGEIHSFDIYPNRLKLIEDGAKRLGICNIHTAVNDGSVYGEDVPEADKILCDVPCSGLGVIRKKPEIRYKDAAEVDKLSDLQYSILCISAKYLKVGGELVYSTCSLNPDENEKNFLRFLENHPNFQSVRVLGDMKRFKEDTDYISLMPHIHGCDGFFIAKAKRMY